MAIYNFDLHNKLCALLGSRNVYFQPGSNITMQYPCIRYKLSRFDMKYADNNPYNKRKSYEIMYIDRDPDSDIPDKISELPMCSFDRHYTADNLNHYVFTIYI